MEGTVKWFNVKKGYGFIAGEDGQEYFVHYTALPDKLRIRENDSVSFDPTENEKGKQAQNVKLSSGQAAAPAQEAEPAEEEPADEPEEEPADEEQEEEPKV